jgi:formylmethanofuran--tetrahydromethanopterin N-formyltransferase
MTTSDGVYIDGVLTVKGDMTGPWASHLVLRDPNVDAAVLETARGGIVRSGSKVGARTKGMMASTNDAYCPTLKGRAGSELAAEVGVVLEIVIDGLTSRSVAESMRAALHASTEAGAAHGLVAVTAGNYGGNLGPHHFHLKEIIA